MPHPVCIGAALPVWHVAIVVIGRPVLPWGPMAPFLDLNRTPVSDDPGLSPSKMPRLILPVYMLVPRKLFDVMPPPPSSDQVWLFPSIYSSTCIRY
jgi:hypothetical protein